MTTSTATDGGLCRPAPIPMFATFFTTAAYREDADRLERCCRFFDLPVAVRASIIVIVRATAN